MFVYVAISTSPATWHKKRKQTLVHILDMEEHCPDKICSFVCLVLSTSDLRSNPKYFRQNYTYFSKFFRNVKSRTYYSIPTNLHKHKLYLLEHHNESFEIWSDIIRINTERKSLIMKSSPVLINHIALSTGSEQDV